jgi:hypothetical protein
VAKTTRASFRASFRASVSTVTVWRGPALCALPGGRYDPAFDDGRSDGHAATARLEDH